jgi:hypothetical protein
MSIIEKFLAKVNGLQYKQEYLCVANEFFQEPLYVYLLQDDGTCCDITYLHKFVGYCPLIFALPSDLVRPFYNGTIKIAFTPLKQNGFFREKDAIATLILKKINHNGVGENIVSFYEGIEGKHHFLSFFHQSVIRLNNCLYGQKPGNVFLKGNLYSQVQIGYAVPRKICLITVEQEGLYNHFPTDLHGEIGNQYYVISLRHEGKACKQVESAGKIVLSDMDVSAYKRVYALGKNHMQPLKERSVFDFSSEKSKIFQLPLPKNTVAYKDLETISSFMWGIHKLILFRIIHSEKVQQQPSTLVHVHNCYATWRSRQGIEGNYLMR